MRGDVSITADELQEILRIFADSHLRELHLEVGETRLHVSKNSADGQASPMPSATAPANAPAAATALADVRAVPAQEPPASLDEPAGAGSELPRHSHEGMACVTAPTVGVFYRRPAPDKPPYVEIGDVVAEGDPVCTLEVMKMFTEVGAGAAGRVVQILAQDGEAVEYGQVLLVLEPLGSP
jgi:acetyl-CoA carboxylase biotin carboxyl carrier protein